MIRTFVVHLPCLRVSSSSEWSSDGDRLFRPAVFEDDLDEVVADEVRIVMCQHVGVDVAEGAPWPVPVAVGERLQDAAFEIGPRVRHGDGVARLFGEVVAADAQHVGLDSGGDKRNLGVEELGNLGRGVQCDAQPDLAGIVRVSPRWSRKSRAAFALSTSKRSDEEAR